MKFYQSYKGSSGIKCLYEFKYQDKIYKILTDSFTYIDDFTGEPGTYHRDDVRTCDHDYAVTLRHKYPEFEGEFDCEGEIELLDYKFFKK